MLLALEAARHHQGITLTNDYMVREQSDSDFIRLPFQAFPTGDRFFFAYKHSRRLEPGIQLIKQWMLKTCRNTGLIE